MIELEVKVVDMDFDLLEKKLLRLGGKLLDYERQVNIIIDSKDNFIENNLNAYLRLRETTSLLDGSKRSTLTLKENLGSKILRKNKEIDVDLVVGQAGENILTILDSLGYKAISRAEKTRKSYILEGMRFDFDSWQKDFYPYTYMEIELSRESELKVAMDLLDIPRDKITKDSIIDLRSKL